MQRLRTPLLRSTKRRHQCHSERGTNRYIRMRTRACQLLSDCIDLRRRRRRTRLRGITFEFVVVGPHASNNATKIILIGMQRSLCSA